MTPEMMEDYVLYNVREAIYQYPGRTLSRVEDERLHPWECKLLDEIREARR